MEGGKATRSAIIPLEEDKVAQISDFYPIIRELCKELDLSCPVMLSKHTHELHKFHRAVFHPSDFVEGVSFHSFVVELIID